MIVSFLGASPREFQACFYQSLPANRESLRDSPLRTWGNITVHAAPTCGGKRQYLRQLAFVRSNLPPRSLLVMRNDRGYQSTSLADMLHTTKRS